MVLPALILFSIGIESIIYEAYIETQKQHFIPILRFITYYCICLHFKN